jgi:hypothetical protein
MFPRALPRPHAVLSDPAWKGTRDAFTFSFAAVVVIQVLTGAYLVERAGFSDDAAHLMNGMVLRD